MNRITYAPPSSGRPASIAGGAADLGDIVSASLEQMRLVENTNASQVALEQSYDSWRNEIRTATGQEPPANPLNPDAGALDELTRQAIMRGEMPSSILYTDSIVAQQRRDFQLWVNDQAGRIPAEASRSWSQFSPEQDAKRRAREADAELGKLLDSRPGWDGFAASFAGGAIGSFYDPLTVGTLVLGGGPGAARTVFGRILTTAAKEALLNGATEAAAQPIVQDWRRQAGLDYGFDQAAQSVLFSTVLGGVIGGAGRGVHEALTGLARKSGKLSDAASRALDGDIGAQREMLEQIRDTLPPEVRGALDQADIADIVTGAPAAPNRTAELIQSRALLQAQNPSFARQLAEPLPLDEDQVARIVNGFAPDMPSEIRVSTGGPAAGPSRPLTTFVKSIGGIEPGSPLAIELNARGIDNRVMPGLFRRDGRAALDNIPFDEVPGEIRATMRPEQGTIYARQQEFIDGLEAEARPDRTAAGRAPDDETEAMLVDVDARVRRVLAARPGSDDGFVREAVTMMADDGLELEAAIGKLEARMAKTPETLPAAADRPLDPEDLAALEARISAEDADEAIDFAALEEAGFTGDVLVPWGDGAISIEALRRELDTFDQVERAVSACQL